MKLEARQKKLEQDIESKLSSSESKGIAQDWESLKKLNIEIKQTLGGKYGISDRPATEVEQRKMEASIEKNL